MGAAPGRAQDEADAAPTAEAMIETAREAYRPPGLRRSCPAGAAGEIVVCAPDPDEYRVTSPVEDAIANDEAADDGVPRAPDVSGLAPCDDSCIRMGPMPRQVHLIDLSAIPEPLTQEEAARVFRAEDGPPPEP